MRLCPYCGGKLIEPRNITVGLHKTRRVCGFCYEFLDAQLNAGQRIEFPVNPPRDRDE